MFFVPCVVFGEPTVTGSAYLDAPQLWLFRQLENKEPDNFIWRQDGAPPHRHLSTRLVEHRPTNGLAAKCLPIKLVSHGLHIHPI
ncbi:hypothetical protein TNCV_3786521 [Trichonephila clavipes]|nr:hypothetical protein TNCV_3786521 [Trichonephila clavipes]